jgi:ABC-type glycerol-3-phosphate transport system substrate-binding protein
MKTQPLALAGVALLALAACSDSKVETAKPDKEVEISVNADGDSAAEEGSVNIDVDSTTGKFDLKMPGGIEANVTVPGGMIDKTDFDIDGVGLYPGAKVGAVNVKALTGKGDASGSATVKIGFSAPADAAAVADWYQQQFEAKKIAVTRKGETLSGKTQDGEDFTLTLVQSGAGAAKGELTIIDGPDAG